MVMPRTKVDLEDRPTVNPEDCKVGTTNRYIPCKLPDLPRRDGLRLRLDLQVIAAPKSDRFLRYYLDAGYSLQ